jgi:hypothetical protein
MSSSPEVNAPMKAFSPGGREGIQDGVGPGGEGGGSIPGRSWLITKAGIISWGESSAILGTAQDPSDLDVERKVNRR